MDDCAYCDGFSANLLELKFNLGEQKFVDEIFVTDDGYLEHNVYMDSEDIDDCMSIHNKIFKINYCPMCGRKLDSQ